MNNEEKNLTPENEGAEENKTAVTKSASGNKLSGGMLAAIIGGAVAVIVAIILLIVLLPGSGNNGQNGDNGDNGGNAGGETETKVTYTVTVVDQNGDPVKDAMINFYPQGGTSFFYLTNENGVTDSYRTDKQVTASVLSVPDGYEYDKLSQKQSFDKDGKLVITVIKDEGAMYTIRLVDQDGNPVVGAGVQMCIPGGACVPFDTLTDENGEVSRTKTGGGYEAQITSLPEGYTDVTGGEYQPFSGDAESGFTVTIVVTKN